MIQIPANSRPEYLNNPVTGHLSDQNLKIQIPANSRPEYLNNPVTGHLSDQNFKNPDSG